ncbi:Monocarboxylate transporter 2 [Holothuria leucospilota]|uniref:Monocarboxylate transporter 2 n=1 Tax=Holothuria leucospilota TaxID=206669 RepID=A0A9Q1HG84_HOLLE|nr:Monocarboxylate transporter 2 [Holothuria leucospilota]
MWVDKWIVLATCCLRLFFFTGCSKSNGVILDDMVHQLNSTHTLVAWAFAVQNGMACMFSKFFSTSPIAKLLFNVFTYREVAVIGGFLTGFGYVYCGLRVTSVWQLYVAFAVSGTGLAFSALPGYVVLKEHFQDGFPTAVSASSLFCSIGIAALPPLLQHLKSVFGTKGSIILFGAITWNLIPAGFGLGEANLDDSDHRDHRQNVTDRRPQQDTNRNIKFVDKYLFFCSSLFYHKNYAILVVTEFLSCFIFISWALFLVSLGENAGLPEEKAVLLSTIGGVGAFFGTGSAIGLFYYHKMNAYTSSLFPLLLNGVCCFGLTLVKDIHALATLSLLTGFCLGLHVSGIIGLIPSLVCRYHFQQAVVVNYFVDGIAYQLGGLVSGRLQLLSFMNVQCGAGVLATPTTETENLLFPSKIIYTIFVQTCMQLKFRGAIHDALGSTSGVYNFIALLSFLALPLIILWACTKEPNRECGP